MNKQDAMDDVCVYILDNDKEYEDYIEMCKENNEDVNDIENSNHVIAKALIALGTTFKDYYN